MEFLGEKEVIMEFLGEKEGTVEFLGEKEVIVKSHGEKEVIVKSHGEKEVKVIDKYQFSPAASINTTPFDFKAILNAKKDEEFSSKAKIRKVWIPKQYLTYKNYLASKIQRQRAMEKRKLSGEMI